MILKRPSNLSVYEMTNSVLWFDGDRILYSSPKEDKQAMDQEEIREEMRKFRELTGGRKVCIILETTSGNSNVPKKSQRAFIAREIASVTKAMAVITTSALNRMIINLFFGFAPPDYPVKIFGGESEAREWIKQYL